jgi:hypothetical protein
MSVHLVSFVGLIIPNVDVNFFVLTIDSHAIVPPDYDLRLVLGIETGVDQLALNSSSNNELSKMIDQLIELSFLSFLGQRHVLQGRELDGDAPVEPALIGDVV